MSRKLTPTEPYLWLNEGESMAVSDDREVVLVRDHEAGGPAVFLYGAHAKAREMLELLEYVQSFVDGRDARYLESDEDFARDLSALIDEVRGRKIPDEEQK